MTDRFNLHLDLPIRFRDQDSMGHVNNAVYLSYLEEARVAYCRRVGVFGGGDTGRRFIIARVEIDYRSSLTIRDIVRIEVRTENWQNRKFHFAYRLTNLTTGALAAEARTLAVTYDYQAERTVPLAAEDRALMESFESGGPA